MSRRVVALGLLALGCAGGAPPAPSAEGSSAPPGGGAAVFDGLLPGGRLAVPLEALAERATLAPGEDFRVVEIGRDAAGSHHVVAIRTAETPHRHDRHDLWVVMLAGHGRWRLGDETRPVGEGSILYVPRGTVHAFTNASDAPAKAFAVYVPPFDGRDRVLAEGGDALAEGGDAPAAGAESAPAD